MPEIFLSYSRQDQALARYIASELQSGGAVLSYDSPETCEFFLLLASRHSAVDPHVREECSAALIAGKSIAAVFLESPAEATWLSDFLFLLNAPKFELSQPDQVDETLKALAVHYRLIIESPTPLTMEAFSPAAFDATDNQVPATSAEDLEKLFFAAAEHSTDNPGGAIFLYRYLCEIAPDYANAQIIPFADHMIRQLIDGWMQQLEVESQPYFTVNDWNSLQTLIDKLKMIDANHPITQQIIQKFKDARFNELQTQAQTEIEQKNWAGAEERLRDMQTIDENDERTLQLASRISVWRICDALYAQVARAQLTDHPSAVALLMDYISKHCPEYGDPDGLLRGALIQPAYLRQLKPQATLRGHNGAVQAMVFSPDGTLLVSGGNDGTLRLWDLEEAQQVAVQRREDGGILSVNFSQDGSLLVTVAENQVVRIWSMPEGREVITLDQFLAPVTYATFTPDTGKLICGYGDGHLEIIQIDDGVILFNAPGHSYEVNQILLSSDGTHVLTASDDRVIKIWELKDNRLRKGQTLSGHTMLVTDIALLPDEQSLVSVSNDGTLRWWNSRDGTEIRSQSHDNGVQSRSVAASPHAPLIATGTVDGLLHLWDAETGTLLRSLKGHSGAINVLTFSPDGSTMVTGSSDRTIVLWRLG
jgi:WD40 repeat protein